MPCNRLLPPKKGFTSTSLQDLARICQHCSSHLWSYVPHAAAPPAPTRLPGPSGASPDSQALSSQGAVGLSDRPLPSPASSAWNDSSVRSSPAAHSRADRGETPCDGPCTSHTSAALDEVKDRMASEWQTPPRRSGDELGTKTPSEYSDPSRRFVHMYDIHSPPQKTGQTPKGQTLQTNT